LWSHGIALSFLQVVRAEQVSQVPGQLKLEFVVPGPQNPIQGYFFRPPQPFSDLLSIDLQPQHIRHLGGKVERSVKNLGG